MNPDKVIKGIENSNVPHISGGPDMCPIIYEAEKDKCVSCGAETLIDKFIVDKRYESIVPREKYDIDAYCKDNGIDNLLIFHNNASMKNTENYYSFPYLLIDAQVQMKAWPEYGKVNLKSKKEKIYNCLNHAEKGHRTILFDNLKFKNLLNYGFVSYIDRGVILPKKIDPLRMIVPGALPYLCFSYYIVEESYFNVVTETHHECNNPDHVGLHITEKTYKALISQPFIIVGQYGHLKKLREWGFQTYPELFDESYDLIENPYSRLNLIIGEIERLCNMDKNELEEIYKSVLWKVAHNRRRILNFEKDEFAYKYFSELKPAGNP